MNAVHAKLSGRWPREFKAQYHAFIQGYDCGRAEGQERIRELENGLREAIEIIRQGEKRMETQDLDDMRWETQSGLPPEIERALSLPTEEMKDKTLGEQPLRIAG